MKSQRWLAIACLTLSTVSSAWATPPIPRSSRSPGGSGTGGAVTRNTPYRPGNGGATTSPYLNLSNGQALSYFTQVRPQLEQRRQFATQGGEIGALTRRLRNADDQLNVLRQPTIRETGHAASFLNYSHYYSPGGGGLFPTR